MKLIIYTDGGSRSNPGPSALGVVIEMPKGKKEYGVRLGVATNNVAEYKAVSFALTKAKELLGVKSKEADIFKPASSSNVFDNFILNILFRWVFFFGFLQ